MTKRLNITLADDVLVRADAFAREHRYSRSGLIAAALEAYVGAGGADLALEETVAVYRTARDEAAVTAPTLERIGPLVRAFFAARDDIEAAWLFGSVARGESGVRSDVDVAVLPREPSANATDQRLDLAGKLSMALGVARVDVVALPAPVLLGFQIASQGVRVYGEGSRAAAEAEIAAITEYWDFESVRRAAHEALADRMRAWGR